MRYYWMMKSEPSTFSIDDLAAKPGQSDGWEGVRNFQARNFIRDVMRPGDFAFFYHSSCEVPGVVGLIEIIACPLPDPTAWDPRSDYYDPKSTPEAPRFWMPRVRLMETFPEVLPLSALKAAAALSHLPVVRPRNRLSVSPVDEASFKLIQKMASPSKK